MNRQPLGTIEAVFDHVGVAVPSIESVDDTLAVVEDPRQRVAVSFADWGGLRVELIEPRGSRSPVATSIASGHPLVHICFRVRDIDDAMTKARENGLHCLAQPTPAAAFDGRRIAWLYSRTFGLIELLEEAVREHSSDGEDQHVDAHHA